MGCVTGYLHCSVICCTNEPLLEPQILNLLQRTRNSSRHLIVASSNWMKNISVGPAQHEHIVHPLRKHHVIVILLPS